MTMHVDHIGLAVGDLERQRDWYRQAFGFDAAAPFEIGAIGLRGLFLLGPDGVAIELLERAGSSHAPLAASPPEALLRQGWAHLCFRVENLDAAFDRAIAAGGTAISPPAPSPEPGVRFAFLADPEGNYVELLDRATEVRA